MLRIAHVLVDSAPELEVLRAGEDHLVNHLQADLEQVVVAVVGEVS